MSSFSKYSPLSITNDIPWISIFNVVSVLIVSCIDKVCGITFLSILCGVVFILIMSYYLYVVIAHWQHIYPVFKLPRTNGTLNLVITYSDIFDFIVSLPAVWTWIYVCMQLAYSESFTGIVYKQHNFMTFWLHFFSFSVLSDNSGYGKIIPQVLLAELTVATAVLFFQIMGIFIFANVIGIFTLQFTKK